jgi:hypothetical protein
MKTLWNNDKVQFARLISELESAGAFTSNVVETLCESMDLSVGEIDEIVERAQNSFDEVKSNL